MKKAMEEHYKKSGSAMFEIFMRKLILCFETHEQTVQIFTDIILFLSYLSKQCKK